MGCDQHLFSLVPGPRAESTGCAAQEMSEFVRGGLFWPGGWMLGSDVTQPPPLQVCVCVCVCVCVARLLLPALLPPSFAVQLPGPFSGPVVQIRGFAGGRSGPGPALARAHPYTHTLALATRTHNPSALGHRDSVGSPARYEDFRNHPDKETKRGAFPITFLRFFFI